MDLLVGRSNRPILAVIVDFAGLISEEGLLVKSLRSQIKSKTDEMGLLIRRVDETVATIVAHCLHWDTTLYSAILHRISSCDFDHEPVEVLDQVALTSTAESSGLRWEGDGCSRGNRRGDLRGWRWSVNDA